MARSQAWNRHLGTAALISALATPLMATGQSLAVVATPDPAVVGATVSLDVLIFGISDLYAHQFSLSFDPAVLQATGVVQGGFMPSGGSTFFDQGTINNATGKVSFVFDTLVGMVPGVTGSGRLASLGFDVVGAGTTSLMFSDAMFLDSMLGTIAVDVTAGSLQAVPEPSSWAMLGLGLAGLAAMRARRSRQPAAR